MIPLLIAIFVLGYACIALEHKIKIDKAATSLFMFGLIWSVYAIMDPQANIGHELLDHLGSTCETLIFLIGAMTIVDLIDMHGGFYIITKHITTRKKFKLLWLMAGITFFMSAILDNMTTTIMLWMRGNITTVPLVSNLILPCIASLVVPLFITSFKFRKTRGNIFSSQPMELRLPQGVGHKFSKGIFAAGVGVLFVQSLFF